MGDQELEDAARDRAVLRECDLVIEERPDGWFAGFVQYDDASADTVSRMSAEGASDRRYALVSLLRADDLTRRRQA
jgi:hypothetical protein